MTRPCTVLPSSTTLFSVNKTVTPGFQRVNKNRRCVAAQSAVYVSAASSRIASREGLVARSRNVSRGLSLRPLAANRVRDDGCE